MARRPTFTDGPTDPGYPAEDIDDEIEEISEDAPDTDQGRIVLGDPSAVGAAVEKTRVGAMPEVPATTDSTVVTANPAAPGAEATVITSNPITAPARPMRGKLVVVEGQGSGADFELQDGAYVIGRSRDVDICLLDIEVSRRHVEVTVSHNGVQIRDMGSGNGTLVNGQPVSETHLVHGDEVQVGEHVLRFEEAGPVAAALAPATARGPSLPATRGPGPAHAPDAAPLAPGAIPSVAAVRRSRRSGGDDRKKKLMLIGGVGGGLLLLLIILAAAGGGEDAGPISVGPSKQMLAEQEFRTGLELFKAQDYDTAVGHFEQALELQPRHQKARQYIDAVKVEQSASAALTEARAAFERGDYAAARAAYQRVPTDSLQSKEADTGLEQVGREQSAETIREADTYLAGVIIEEIVAGKSLSEAKTALEETDLAPAKSLFEEAARLHSGSTEAASGLERVATRQQEIDARIASIQAELDRIAKGKVRTAAQIRAEQIASTIAPGQRAFNAKNFNEALSKFEEGAANGPIKDARDEAARRAAALKRFMPAYNKGMAASQNRQSGEAVKHLGAALKAAKTIDSGSGKGKVTREIEETLGKSLYLEGRVAFNADKYEVAYRHWSKARKSGVDSNLVDQGLKDLLAKGKELYLEGYTQEALNVATACAKYKRVIKMTPSDFEYHDKAQKRIDSKCGG